MSASDILDMMNSVPVTTVVAALAILIGGLFFIGLVNFLLKKILKNMKDGTRDLISYSVCVLLLIGLLILLLNLVGTGTTPALLIYVLVAILVSTALQHLVQNFAAGTFLLFRRPFRKGSHITTNGISGYVRSWTLASTTIVTDEGYFANIPNSAVVARGIVVAENTENYMVTVRVPVRMDADPDTVIRLLTGAAADIPHLSQDPKPAILIGSLQPEGVAMYDCFLWCEYGHRYEVIHEYNHRAMEILKSNGWICEK